MSRGLAALRSRGVGGLALAASLALGGCDTRDAIARVWTRQLALDPPQLWRADTLGPHGQVWSSVEICVDRKLREGFTRANPAINGDSCEPLGYVVVKPGLYALRCRALGRTFGVTVANQGDPARDVTVRYAVTELEPSVRVFAQTLRYHLVGPCPSGWRIGDRRSWSGAAKATS
jgi:hypothetical protein